MKIKSILTIMSFALISAAEAQVNFDQLTYRGTGCPQGTVSSVVSPDGSTLSILFDEFRAEVPQYDGNNDNESLPPGRGRNTARNSATLNHKNCALSFTANIPQGTKAEGLEVSLQARGAVVFDQGIEGTFAAILVGYNGLANSRGKPTVIAQKHWRALSGPLDEEYIAEPVAVVKLNSGCAAQNARSIRFDLKNHIQAQITNADTTKHGIITVDSQDMKGLLKFTLRTKPCGGGRMSPRGR
ncbi:MAG TPA: DUF4360 domain-containing protein [Bacteriovoracaceae bacterium]|nr:DUF4360 domain-containing protein [Bacteriovoracaceae bacterium]